MAALGSWANVTAVASRNAMRSKRPLLALVSRSCSSAGQHWDHGVVGDDEENVLQLKLAFNTTAW